MEESTWETVTLKLKRVACLNFELIRFQFLQSPISNAKSVTLMILQLIRLEYIHGHCCSWWMIDIAFCQVFLLSCSATLFTAVFFTRKQQLAKYHTAFVLDFWSSLQTTFAQPKDRWARRWAPFTWPSFFYGDQLPPWFLGGQLPSSHRRTCLPPSQEDLELLLEDLLAQQTGRNVELFTGSWVSGKLKSSLSHQTWITFQFLEC